MAPDKPDLVITARVERRQGRGPRLSSAGR